jgi:hypothetical protein
MITSPSTGPLDFTSVNILVAASDPAPGSGVKQVDFWYRYCPGNVCGGENFIGTDNTPPTPFTITWTFPSCGTMPEDVFRIVVRATDNCNNVSDNAEVNVRLVGRGCFRIDAARTPGARPEGASWLSELRLPGARGQVVVDGAQAVFPSAGSESFAAALPPGQHRFEATLVEAGGRGAAGLWRFDLQSLRVAPGSLRVVAGEVVQLGADVVAFRLRGREGERLVFTFEVAGE